MFQSLKNRSFEIRGVPRRAPLPPRRRRPVVVTFLMILAVFAISRTAAADDAMRVVRGKHIVLKADTGSSELLNELVDAFDAAVEQWRRFWQVPVGALDRWTVDAFLIEDRERFRRSGDLPPVTNFPFGFATGGNVWVMRQPSDYYTRHLLLHEGAHALQIHLFGGTGPSWYAEGMAERLGVHRGEGESVQVGIVPPNREAVPYWGRFKLMKAARQAGGVPTLETVLNYPLDLKSDVASYGWSWAAVSLLTEYPDYRPITLRAARDGSDQTVAFTRRVKQQLDSVWPIVQARWRVLTATMDYGFDWRRERVDLAITDRLWSGAALQLAVRADRGWQSAGVRFPPGASVSISATGRCTLADEPKPWVSEPPGVTIRYANDRPLGQLLVAVVPNQTTEADRLEPLEIHAVDPNRDLKIRRHSWLLFRINDDLGDLANNRGGYRVTLQRER
jgi:hypothetical protein